MLVIIIHIVKSTDSSCSPLQLCVSILSLLVSKYYVSEFRRLAGLRLCVIACVYECVCVWLRVCMSAYVCIGWKNKAHPALPQVGLSLGWICSIVPPELIGSVSLFEWNSRRILWMWKGTKRRHKILRVIKSTLTCVVLQYLLSFDSTWRFRSKYHFYVFLCHFLYFSLFLFPASLNSPSSESVDFSASAVFCLCLAK